MFVGSFWSLLLFAFLCGPWTATKACNLSSFTVNSITPVGSDTLIQATVCIGGGRTGTVAGADGDTRTFGVRFFGGNATPVNVISFTPATVTPLFGGCNMPGADIGPQGPPFNSRGTLLYIDPGYYGIPPCVFQPFACVTSTALCGNINQNCINLTFLVDRLSDSICVMGIESGGNPVGGCPCSSMGSALRLGAPLIVWGDLEAQVNAGEVTLHWSSLQEFETGVYHVERHLGSGAFKEIAQVAGAGVTQAPLPYTFQDQQEGLVGTIGYRIRFVDQNGRTSYSKIASVYLPVKGKLAIQSLYPVPVRDILQAQFVSMVQGDLEWRLIDASGRRVQSGRNPMPQGEHEFSFDLAALAPGTYFFNVSLAGETLTRKLVKL